MKTKFYIILLILLSGCSLLPDEPWMYAKAESFCEAGSMEMMLVNHMAETCPPIYIPAYCKGLATIDFCIRKDVYE